MTIYRRYDGRTAKITNRLQRNGVASLYKVEMIGHDPIWITDKVFRQEFSIKPITEKKYRTPRYQVTA